MSEAKTRGVHVVVIGGGISGLTAAHRLLGRGVRVTVIEASGRVGGKLYAGDIAGAPVDLGAESMLALRPEAVELAREVGLTERLEPPVTASATLWTRGALRPMPTGHVMGVPGDLDALAASGVLSEEGLARAAQDRELPPTELGDDVAVGEYVAVRLGREAVDRLVEPLLGGVYAGDAYRISMRAAVPRLLEAARSHRSLLEAVGETQRRSAGRGPAGPVFMGIDGGMGRLPLAVADAVRAAGGEILLDSPAQRMSRTGDGWEIAVGSTAIRADGVVLAVQAPAAARLLASAVPAAAAELETVEYASMALATLAFRTEDVTAVLPEGSGFLVPAVDGRTIKASTFSSRKWGWTTRGRDADPGLFLLRTSIGRFGDDTDLKRDDADLVEVSLHDLHDAVGLTARPVETRITRWDGGLPQYPVGHLDRVARVRSEVAKVPGLRVCGAVYDGVGIPACVASARAAADDLVATLAGAGNHGEGE